MPPSRASRLCGWARPLGVWLARSPLGDARQGFADHAGVAAQRALDAAHQPHANGDGQQQADAADQLQPQFKLRHGLAGGGAVFGQHAFCSAR